MWACLLTSLLLLLKPMALAYLLFLRLSVPHFFQKKSKFFQASTGDIFGTPTEIPQNENTPYEPQSPYAIAKFYAHLITAFYRNTYGIFACNGILFNHESPRRQENCIMRKIAKAAAYYALEKKELLEVGNLDAKRDWGYAPDYVEAMWLMLQQENPGDYVIATGEIHSVRELVELAYSHVGVEIEWNGLGIDEVGVDKTSGSLCIKINPQLFRPYDPLYLVGNGSKAETVLGWKPKISFALLVEIMVNADLEEYKKKQAETLAQTAELLAQDTTIIK